MSSQNKKQEEKNENLENNKENLEEIRENEDEEKNELDKKETINDKNEVDEENFKEKYLRAIADYQNLVKQNQKERTEFVKFAISDFLQDILPVYDHLKLSIKSLNEEEKKSPWVEGVSHVLKQFKEILNNHGVLEIETIGQKFDHNLMDALEGEGEYVDKEIMSGYTLNGKVIKPAKVTVKNNN